MKSHTYTTEARILKALSNPKRLEIIHLLGHRDLTATDIQRMTGFPQANLSQHLRELKLARVIVAVRKSRFIHYRVAHRDVLHMLKMLEDVSSHRAATKHETSRSEVQDLVCQMWVEPSSAKWQTIYKGATYFFCASGCQKHFMKSPEKYVQH